MKTRYIIRTSILLGFSFFLLFSPALGSAQEQKEKSKKEEKAEEKVFIPKEVKSALEQGLATRQARQDIPFSVVNHLYLPARDGLHNIFFLKMKNADLGFAPQVLATQKQKKEKEEPAPAAEAQAPSLLEAKFNIFLQFNSLEENKPPQVVREAYIPALLATESSAYDPMKEETYCIGYPTYSGKYLLAIAITSLDLKKMGTFYFEFSLPDPGSFTKELGTTPIFFVKEMKQIASPEIRVDLHKGFFTYSILQIVPNINNTFSPGENLDIFFFVFGAQPNEQQKYQLETSYEIKKGEETVIRYEPTTYTNPMVSQPLPMKQTVIIKSETEGEKTESRDLTPGNYTLLLKIADKITGYSVTKSVDLEVK